MMAGMIGLGGCTGFDGEVAPPTVTPSGRASSTTTRVTSTTRVTTVATSHPVGRASVPVLSRRMWGGEPGQGFSAHRLERITIHHTAAVTNEVTSGAERARRHLRYHYSLGWPDLAYHHLIDASGVIYEGRPLEAVGDTATEYDPTGHYLPCLEGDFDVQQPSRPQLDSLVRLVAAVTDDFGLDPATISGHGDRAPSTTCPGAAVMGMVDDIRRKVVEEAGRHRIHLVG